MIGGKIGEIIHKPCLRMGAPWQYRRRNDGDRFSGLLRKAAGLYGVPYPEFFQLQHEPGISVYAWKDNAPDENGG